MKKLTAKQWIAILVGGILSILALVKFGGWISTAYNWYEKYKSITSFFGKD